MPKHSVSQSILEFVLYCTSDDCGVSEWTWNFFLSFGLASRFFYFLHLYTSFFLSSLTQTMQKQVSKIKSRRTIHTCLLRDGSSE